MRLRRRYIRVVARSRKDNEAKARRAEVGRRIDLARELVGLSKRELADACEVSPAAVTGWITGRHAPSPESLVAISRATRKPASFFEIGGVAELDAREVFERELVRLVGARVGGELLDLTPEEFRTRLELGASPLGDAERRISTIAADLLGSLTADDLETFLELVLTAAELRMFDELVRGPLQSARAFSERMDVDPEGIRRRAKFLASLAG